MMVIKVVVGGDGGCSDRSEQGNWVCAGEAVGRSGTDCNLNC
jgi:hypothetical protein